MSSGSAPKRFVAAHPQNRKHQPDRTTGIATVNGRVKVRAVIEGVVSVSGQHRQWSDGVKPLRFARVTGTFGACMTST